MYDSSDAIARDTSTFKHAKIKELISSDPYSNYNRHEHDQLPSLGTQTQTSLMRYRSAPSAFYANLLDDDFLAPDSSNEEDGFFSRQQQQLHPNSHEFSPSSTSMKVEAGIHYVSTSTSSSMYNSHAAAAASHLPPNNHNHNHLSTFGSMNSSTTSNLIRQSSSPAGFFSSFNTEEINGFAAMRGAENKMINSSSRLNNHINFASEPTSSPMLLPQIPENRNEMSDLTFENLKRTRDGVSKALQRQNGISGHYTPSLVHHMSLPKTSSEMLTAEKYLRFEQDTVPCKTRAKRGFATHPRSIAERVRRTRISARMKKLQELFPTIDKNTSTADMLDLSVQYIKDLQKDLQTLNDARSRCKCSSTQ